MDRVQKRLRCRKSGRGQSTGPQEVSEYQIAATGFQAKGRKTVKDSLRQTGKIADQEGKEADIQRLLHQPLDDVLIRRPGPEQASQRHIQNGQCSGQ